MSMRKADPAERHVFESPAGNVTLEQSYDRCRELNKSHGQPYYWATLALPRHKRRDIWVLRGFCCLVDELVDEMSGATAEAGEAALTAFGDRFFDDLARGDSDDLVLKAVVRTVRMLGLHPDVFQRFLRSRAMDLTVDRYETWEDLLFYMDGSAAVIAEMILPVLEPLEPAALEHARDLGFAIQLTDVLRGVDEDLDRGRIYVPCEDLERFGVDPADRTNDDAWKALMAFEIGRCRELFASADRGVAMLPPSSARCVKSARMLYSRILDGIEAADMDVFAHRVCVPTWQKAALVGRLALSR